VLSRVKERDHFATNRITRRNVRAFEPIAVKACPAQVIEGVFTAVLDGNNVIGLVREECILFGQ
jgi:hypothetical protein